MPRKMGEIRHQGYRVMDTWIYKVKDVTIDRMKWIEPKGRGKGHWVPDERDEDDKYERSEQRVRNKVVKIEWRMIKRTTQSEEPPHPTESVKFEVYCSELDFKLEGTDIEALRAAMWGMLDAHFEVKWERYYLVEVRPTRVYEGDGAGMEMGYHDVYKGTTYDGKTLLKRWRGHEMKIEVWPGEFTDKGGKVIACIEANEMNKAALKEFSRRIDVLREKLADFLRPEVIMQNLANLSGLMLLPPVPPEFEEADEEGEDPGIAGGTTKDIVTEMNEATQTEIDSQRGG